MPGDNCGPSYDPGPYGAPLVATGQEASGSSPPSDPDRTVHQSRSQTHRIVKRTLLLNQSPTPSSDAPSFLAVSAGSVWLAGGSAQVPASVRGWDGGGASVSEVDPESNKVVRTIRSAAEPRRSAESPPHETPLGAIGDSYCNTIGQ